MFKGIFLFGVRLFSYTFKTTYVQPVGCICGQVGDFVLHGLGFRCSISSLHTENLTLV